ncbi:MAG: histone deacetylase [Candidatus Firestonebacteria bacterium]|nr:histone deacetylase [Candidatus Firestonebacteria bacterium]
MTSKTGFVYSPYYLKHDTGHHPESPKRLQAIIDILKETSLYNKLIHLDPYKATEQEISLIHDADYAKEVWKKCTQNIRNIDMDTVICEESYNVALVAVGGVLRAVDAIVNGEVKNVFCAIRPPGHHAEIAQGMGFCLFNNIAIGARYAQNKYKIKKILIIDWDAHHGNGTQHIFYDDPSVLYFSIHQFPHYPGTGRKEETGSGKGKGFTINIPVKSGINEEDFIKYFSDGLLPEAEKFKPDLIMISAGFDSHKEDFLAQLPVTESGYVKMTEIVKKLADKTCSGKIISVLEGGYNLKALARSVCVHIESLTK